MLFVRDYLVDQTVMRSAFAERAPLVSVVLPTYRRCQNGMLKRAISSVLSQTLTDFELLVMDDGSTDGSYDLIEDFRTQDPRVVHVRHERNSGIHSVRLNEGIELARGKYLAFQFDDDCWRPNALQALAAEAARHPGPTVVVGHSHFTGTTGGWTLPVVELSIVTLYEQNRFANNGVLVPRQLVDQYGIYDCHIGMRRLCDWDLWLRYIKHVPFIVIDDIVSDVFESTAGSIGLTVPWDLPLFRYFHDIPRNHLLTPDRWRDYQVDALRVGEVEIEKDLRRQLYEEHIVPYYLRFRHSFPAVEGFAATLPPERKSVLYTKNSYDVSNDVTLGHYDALSNRRGNYKAFFQPLSQVGPDWARDVDALLLVRTVEDQAVALLDESLTAGIPAGLYLDDDLLNFHEYGSEFDYLAPGAPYHRNLSEIIERTDAVWVTNHFIQETVLPLNQRTIPHNNAVPSDALPVDIRPRDPQKPWRIGYVGSGYRLEEFQQIWDGLMRLSREMGDQLNFEFWGLDITALPRLSSPVKQQPFTFSYLNYLARLKDAGFDILLTPLLGYPRPRLAKSLIKYYETAVAGALGIFSNVPPYESLPDGLTCLKANNTAGDWYQALRQALDMPTEQFDLMRRRALEHVREEYTEVVQIHLHEAACRATEFHARTRAQRHSDGRPRVMYVLHSAHFGGGEIQLWRRLRLARNYGIEPIVVLPRVLQETQAAQQLDQSLRRDKFQVEFVDYTCFDKPRSPAEFRSELERTQVRTLLERCAPALVHTVTFIPSFGQICQQMNIPHVASLYAVDEDFAWLNGKPDFKHCAIAQSDTVHYAKRWSDLLGVEKFCAREVAPEAVFALGQTRHLQSVGEEPKPLHRPVRLVVTGTLQERKSQLEIIEAVGRLCHEGWDCQLDIYGYTHFFPEYVAKCRERIRALSIEDRVAFCGFGEDVVKILESADIVLSLSTFESFPSAIKEAMAAGVLVVATPVGGIPELIIDGVTGILCADISVEAMTDGIRRALKLSPTDRVRIIEQARRVARSEFHPRRAANDLLTMYNRATALTRAATSLSVQPTANLERASSAQFGSLESPRYPPASFVPLRSTLMYRLVPQRSNWIGLDVLLGTNQRPAEGALVMYVFSPSGHCLRRVSVDLAHAHDNDWLSFRFPAIANLAGSKVVVKFTLLARSPQTLISLFEATPPEPKFRRLLRRGGLEKSGNSLYCRMWYVG